MDYGFLLLSESGVQHWEVRFEQTQDLVEE